MNFGFLMFDGLEELDLIGPWELIRVWSKQEGGPENCFTVAGSKPTVTCAKGLRIAADHSFATCPALDYLLIPGGEGTRSLVNDAATIEFVRAQAANCRGVLSVCTGAFVLQAAGLLQGKQATTHWYSLERLRAFADVQVVERRYLNDGKFWIAAGVSAGMDMALNFIASQAGEEVAGKVQLYTEYYPDGRKYGIAAKAADLPSYIRDY